MSTIFPVTNPPRHRVPKWLLLLIGIPILCVLLNRGVSYFLDRLEVPEYIEIDIPPSDGRAWSYTERTVQTWEDSGATFFIWRRATTLFQPVSTDRPPWSWESVIGYFDKQLIERDWERAEHHGDSPCDVYLPESEFLDKGKNGYVVYKHPGSKVYQPTPTICLAVWPFDSEWVSGFEIVLLTSNPSPLTVFFEGLDSP